MRRIEQTRRRQRRQVLIVLNHNEDRRRKQDKTSATTTTTATAMSIDIVVDDAIQSMVVVVDGGPVAQFSAESNGTAAALHCTYLSYRSIPHTRLTFGTQALGQKGGILEGIMVQAVPNGSLKSMKSSN